MARAAKTLPKKLNDEAVIERVQSILINAAEGQRNVGDDRNYPAVRSELLRRFSDPPLLVTTHPTVDSFSAYMRGIADRRQRVRRIRLEFEPLFLDQLQPNSSSTDAADWTGIQSPTARLIAVKSLLPLAQAAVEGLISTLAEPGDNGGPILDEREVALDYLHNLHEKIGDLLNAVNSGHFEDELGEGLAAEVSRYARRAAHALRDDPVPYLANGLILGVLSACGMPTIGSFLGGVAQNIRKNNA